MKRALVFLMAALALPTSVAFAKGPNSRDTAGRATTSSSS